MIKDSERKALVEFYVEKSLSALDDAKVLSTVKNWDACISRLYYACFYIVNALLIKNLDTRSKTHTGIKTLFNNHFVRTGLVSKEVSSFYSVIMESRGENDYGDFVISTEDYVLPLIPQTEAFINTLKQLIV